MRGKINNKRLMREAGEREAATEEAEETEVIMVDSETGISNNQEESTIMKVVMVIKNSLGLRKRPRQRLNRLDCTSLGRDPLLPSKFRRRLKTLSQQQLKMKPRHSNQVK